MFIGEHELSLHYLFSSSFLDINQLFTASVGAKGIQMYLLSLNRPYREFVIFTSLPEDYFILKTFQGMEGCIPKEK